MSEPADALAGCGIVYFGNGWHSENRTSSHHIATRLARRAPLLYVDSPGMRAPSASGRDFRRSFAKLFAALRKPREVQPGLWHCTVPQLPWRRLPFVDSLNRRFGAWAVRRAMRAVGFARRISWFVVPHPGFLARRLGESLCVYYCIDDYAAHPGVDSALIEQRDRELSATADLLFVAPPALLERKRTMNAATTYAPHGVDVELFARAFDPATELPAGARGLARPVIGYFGSLHEWIDLDLIEWLARARPQWTFLLIGYAAVDVSALAALPNVRLVGAQPYETLPAWAKAFDVALIPSVGYGVSTAGKVMSIPRGSRVLVLQDDHTSPVLEWMSRAEAAGFTVETVKQPADGDWTSAVLEAIEREGAAPLGLVSISSVGAGALGVSALFFLYPRLPTLRIVGSDIAHAVPLTLVAGIGHWFLGSVDWSLLGSLLIGSLPGIWLGSHISTRVPDRVLRPILATMLVLVGSKLIAA